MCGLVKNHQEAYELGCAALRRQLQELKDEEAAKHEAAARAEAEAIASNEFKLV
jgi:predicted metal-binding protein